MTNETHKDKPMRSFKELFERAKEREEYWVETAILEFTMQAANRMHIMGMKNKELAEKMGRKESFITRLLGGNNNFTLRTMVRIARALDAEIGFVMKPKMKEVDWLAPKINTVESKILCFAPQNSSEIIFGKPRDIKPQKEESHAPFQVAA